MRYTACLIVLFLLLQGCTAVRTFPTVARAGDTVSVMVGGMEKARKETISVVLTDVNGIEWDLQVLGLVRSVFNVRADGVAHGLHYSSYLDTYNPWAFGHEPVQTVLAVDLPDAVPAGDAYLTVDTYTDDNSSGIAAPYIFNFEVIDGVGASDIFKRKSVSGPGVATDFAELEPAPHAKISFGVGAGIIGAASLVVDFDETVVNPDDINIYVPESTVRGSVGTTGVFGETQRMVYWRQDGQQLFIDVVAPQGINSTFLKLYAVHPRGVGDPGFSLTSTVYDVDGNEISSITPTLEYFP